MAGPRWLVRSGPGGAQRRCPIPGAERAPVLRSPIGAVCRRPRRRCRPGSALSHWRVQARRHAYSPAATPGAGMVGAVAVARSAACAPGHVPRSGPIRPRRTRYGPPRPPRRRRSHRCPRSRRSSRPWQARTPASWRLRRDRPTHRRRSRAQVRSTWSLLGHRTGGAAARVRGGRTCRRTIQILSATVSGIVGPILLGLPDNV